MRSKLLGAATAAAVATSLALVTPAAAAAPTAAVALAAASAPSAGVVVPGPEQAAKASQYAVEMVRAWGVGDTAAVQKASTPDVAKTLFAFANPGGAHWAKTSSRAIDTMTYSTFVDEARSKALVVGVDTPLVPEDHAATVARFVNFPPLQQGATQYAAELVRAWGAGETAAVQQAATPDVAKTLFAFANPGGAHWTQTSSRPINAITYTSFVDETRGKALVLGVNTAMVQKSADHAATIARFSDYPAKPTMNANQYADELVSAWGIGSHAEVGRLATAEVAGTLFGYALKGGPDWVRTASEGAAGTIYVTYRSATHSATLTVGVNNTIDLTGAEHAVHSATFTAVK